MTALNAMRRFSHDPEKNRRGKPPRGFILKTIPSIKVGDETAVARRPRCIL
jgi:hypothetical protein